MSAVIRLACLTLFAACGFAPAQAADLLPPPPVLDRDEIVEVGTGWYLRGDVGYVDYNTPRDIAFHIPTVLPLNGERLDKTFSVGGGIGYQLTNWLRADATIDHRFGAELSGTRPFPTYDLGYVRDQADVESTSYLLNAYVDLGYWSGVTPYLGAGIGLASNRFTNIRREFYALGQPAGTGFPTPHTTNNLAWALMAGVAVDVGSGFKIDLGYRYTHLGDARTRIDGPGAGIRTDDLKTHEIRLGARYTID